MKHRQRRYIADLHFGHEKVARLRGFPNTLAHDRAVIEAWFRSVPDAQTEVFVLGDLSSGGAESTRIAHSTLGELPGVKHLILGNHDRAHPLHRNGRKHQPELLGIFASVSTADRVKINGHSVMLSHFPFAGDHEGTADRHNEWRLRDEGQWLLHGHVHEMWKVQGRQINVGFDHWRDCFPTDNTIATIIDLEAS